MTERSLRRIEHGIEHELVDDPVAGRAEAVTFERLSDSLDLPSRPGERDHRPAAQPPPSSTIARQRK
jgi:hypothetical protein